MSIHTQGQSLSHFFLISGRSGDTISRFALFPLNEGTSTTTNDDDERVPVSHFAKSSLASLETFVGKGEQGLTQRTRTHTTRTRDNHLRSGPYGHPADRTVLALLVALRRLDRLLQFSVLSCQYSTTTKSTTTTEALHCRIRPPSRDCTTRTLTKASTSYQ